MSKKRCQLSAEFKAQVGLEALRGVEPIHAIAAGHKVHPVQVSQWKKEVDERLPEVFSQKPDPDIKALKERESELFEEIGRLKMELEWLKKKLASSSVEQRRCMIEPAHPKLSVTQQCDLFGLPRSSFYYEPRLVSTEQLKLMRAIDELYLAYPFYGSRQMTRALRREGYEVIGRKRVQRLMRLMGLEAFYQKPKRSRPDAAHKIYPYLPRNLAVRHPIRSGRRISPTCRSKAASSTCAP